MLFWTASFVICLLHFYFAVFAHFGGLAKTIRGQGVWIAYVNYLLTVLWAIDITLMWTATRHDYRIWNRHRYVHLVIFIAFVFFAAIRNEGVVRWLGIALAASLVGTPILRIWRESTQRAKEPAEQDGANDIPSERFLGGTKEAETQHFSRFIRDINLSQRRSKDRAYAAKISRAFHAKQHLGTTFTVSEDIPSTLRVGLFNKA